MQRAIRLSYRTLVGVEPLTRRREFGQGERHANRESARLRVRASLRRLITKRKPLFFLSLSSLFSFFLFYFSLFRFVCLCVCACQLRLQLHCLFLSFLFEVLLLLLLPVCISFSLFLIGGEKHPYTPPLHINRHATRGLVITQVEEMRNMSTSASVVIFYSLKT